MEPSREIFWNIPSGWILYIFAAMATGVLLYAIYGHYRRWRLGRPAGLFDQPGRRIWDFLVTTVRDGLLHWRFFRVGDGKSAGGLKPREFYPGLAHFLIFTGCLVFLLAAFLDFLSHYFFHFMEGDFYLAYSVVTDGFAILAIIGVIMAMLRRYGLRPARLDNQGDDLVALLLILVVVVTGFIVEGLRMAATEVKLGYDWAPWSPGGYALALAFSGFEEGTLRASHAVLWWCHMFLSLGAIIYVALYNSRLFHIIWDPVNVFFRNLGPKGALKPIDFEAEENYGAGKIEDFTWKQLLDLDACTRCGRCQDACPAYFSGKKLNPKQVIQDLRVHLYQVYPSPFKSGLEERKDMLTEAVTEEVIWDCTTCRACQEACPVFVEHVDKIIDMRRNLAMERSQLPEAAQEALRCLGTRWHPFRGTVQGRLDWAEGLEVKVLAEDSDIDTLYWVGCTAALEERNMKVARATARILGAAGVNFGILGEEEMCCGDPARRMGDEYLFQTICQQNVEILNGYKVKRIVTSCPHCFNSLKHEYPQFGGNFEVVHHSQLIAGLIEEGRLKLGKLDIAGITYHDSCYLSRYNDIYRPPRQILKSVISGRMVELGRAGNNGFCCGGGGGHMWMEEEPDKRVNNRRIDEVIDTGVPVVATACPYCLTMFDDAIKAKEAEETLRAMDLSELVAQVLPPEEKQVKAKKPEKTGEEAGGKPEEKAA